MQAAAEKRATYHKSVRKKLNVLELSSSEDEHDIAELQLQIAEMHHELEQQQDYIKQLERSFLAAVLAMTVIWKHKGITLQPT